MPNQDAHASGPRRAARIDTHRIQLGSAEGVLLNLSATGALVRLPTRCVVGTEAAFGFHVDDRQVTLPCRVVRCTETSVSLEGATWLHTEFETAVVFDRRSDVLAPLVDAISPPSGTRPDILGD